MNDEKKNADGAREVLFRVKDLHVTYRRPGQKAVEAVRGVSFDLHAGETLGIVGESGSGKSTIAKTLMLLQPSSGGEVLFRGTNIASFTSAERRQYRRDVQMVFQDAVGSLNPRMTIRQALNEILQKSMGGVRGRQEEEVATSGGVRGRQEEEETTLGGVRGRQSPRSLSPTPESLLDIVGLSKAVLDQYPRELSGGQCQRASFARALAVNPKVLVADEPVSALDVSVQARILNLMRDLRRELDLAILLIAHDLSVVRNVCDRVCVMHHGLFEDAGPAEDVFDRPQSDYTKNLLAAVPDVRRSLTARART